MELVDPRFLTVLGGDWIDDDRFCLGRDLVYRSAVFQKFQIESGAKIQDGIILIKKGFVTDFASVPRVPIIYELWGNRAHHEAVPHDFGYQTHIAPKPVIDSIFLEAMKARNKAWYIRYPMYEGVVLGGASSYESGPSRFLILNPPQTN